MKNYTWAKGYKYTKVPVFFKSWDFFGFSFTIESHKTRRRRVGAKITTKEVWNIYEKILKGS